MDTKTPDGNTINQKLQQSIQQSLSLVLQSLSHIGQSDIARHLGVSDSTLSRIKSERLEEVIKVVGACGLKIVPQDYSGDHTEFIDAVLVIACYGIKAIRRDQRLLNE